MNNKNQKKVCEQLSVYVSQRWRNLGFAAKHYGISQGHMSNICTGNRTPTKKMLKDLGFKKIKIPATYRYIKISK